jgi:hypothetical protein
MKTLATSWIESRARAPGPEEFDSSEERIQHLQTLESQEVLSRRLPAEMLERLRA